VFLEGFQLIISIIALPLGILIPLAVLYASSIICPSKPFPHKFPAPRGEGAGAEETQMIPKARDSFDQDKIKQLSQKFDENDNRITQKA
jgi:CBS-domain-containing membrane protein